MVIKPHCTPLARCSYTELAAVCYISVRTQLNHLVSVADDVSTLLSGFCTVIIIIIDTKAPIVCDCVGISLALCVSVIMTSIVCFRSHHDYVMSCHCFNSDDVLWPPAISTIICLISLATLVKRALISGEVMMVREHVYWLVGLVLHATEQTKV